MVIGNEYVHLAELFCTFSCFTLKHHRPTTNLQRLYCIAIPFTIIYNAYLVHPIGFAIGLRKVIMEFGSSGGRLIPLIPAVVTPLHAEQQTNCMMLVFSRV